jgi:hypothetical protein
MTGIGTQSAPAANAIKMYSKSGIPYYRNTSGEYVLSGGSVAAGGGDFYGVASSTADDIITFADTGGKTAKDSGKKLSDLVYKDGSTTLTGALPFGGYKGTGVGNGTLAQDISTQVLAAHGTAYVRKEGSNYISTLATGADYQTGTDPDVIVNALFDYYASIPYSSIEVLCPLTGINTVLEYHTNFGTLRFDNLISGAGSLLKISGSYSKVDFLSLVSTTDATGNNLELSGDFCIVNGNYVNGAGNSNPTGVLFAGSDNSIVNIGMINNTCYGVLFHNGSSNICSFTHITDTNYAIRMWGQWSSSKVNGNIIKASLIDGAWVLGVSIDGGTVPTANFEGNIFEANIIGAGTGALKLAPISNVDDTFTMFKGCADGWGNGKYDILDESAGSSFDMNYARALNVTIAPTSMYRNSATGEMKLPNGLNSGATQTNGVMYFYDVGTDYQIAVYDKSAGLWRHTNLV